MKNEKNSLAKIYIMKFLFPALLLFMAVGSKAQQVPDSVKSQAYTRTCECITLMKIDGAGEEAGINIFRNCADATIDIFAGYEVVKKNWRDDKEWTDNFYKDLIAYIKKSCPAYQKFLEKTNQKNTVPVPLTETDARYFLTAETMNKKNMELNPNGSNATMNRWSAKDMNNSSIQLVFDIRYAFENDKDAAAYLKANLEELNEGGGSTVNSLTAFGADESHVYTENPKLKSLFSDMDMRQYNFVFRVKKVVAKVFISGTKKATYNDALVYAKEAIERIKAVK